MIFECSDDFIVAVTEQRAYDVQDVISAHTVEYGDTERLVSLLRDTFGDGAQSVFARGVLEMVDSAPGLEVRYVDADTAYIAADTGRVATMSPFLSDGKQCHNFTVFSSVEEMVNAQFVTAPPYIDGVYGSSDTVDVLVDRLRGLMLEPVPE